MIRQTSAKDEATLLRLAQSQPVTGPLVEMHWRIAGENPHMPFQFFLVDNTAVLKTTGQNATLCGVAADPEELAGFLTFCGVRRLTALGQCPAGWQVLEENLLMLRAPEASFALSGKENAPVNTPGCVAAWNPVAPNQVSSNPATPPETSLSGTKAAGRRTLRQTYENPLLALDTCPPLGEVLALLEAGSAQSWTPAERDGFYADLAARRNHGFAVVYGVRDGPHTLAATAGLYALTAAEGYVACVETRREHQGKGYATALLRRLIADFPARTLSLLCAPEHAGFYTALGFAKTNQRGLISAPQKDGTNT